MGIPFVLLNTTSLRDNIVKQCIEVPSSAVIRVSVSLVAIGSTIKVRCYDVREFLSAMITAIGISIGLTFS